MRGAKRREQILDCAAELFAEKGYHATNITDIVTRAGVARGTFYLYFKDKRTIFEELVDGFIGDVDSALVRIDPELGTQACLDMMRDNIRLVFEICIQRRALTKILLSAAVGLDAEFDQKLIDFYTAMDRLLATSLRLGQEMGVVRDHINVEIVAVYVLGALKEMLYQIILRHFPVSTHELTDELLTLISDGIFHPEMVESVTGRAAARN